MKPLPQWAGPLCAAVAGCLAALLLLEAGLVAGGRWVLALRDRANRAEQRAGGEGADDDGASRILCLGESITLNSYPPRLAAELEKRVPGARFRVFDQALPSTDSNYEVNVMDETCDRFSPDVVIVMMGVNDRRDPVLFRDYFGKAAFYRKMRVYRFGRFILSELFSPGNPEWDRINESQVWSPAPFGDVIEGNLRALPENSPGWFEALLKRHSLRGEGAQLLAAYNRAAALFPARFGLQDYYLLLLVRVFLPAGDLESAENILTWVSEADPADPVAPTLLVKLLAQRGDAAGAMRLAALLEARGVPKFFDGTGLDRLLHDEPSYDDVVFNLDALGWFAQTDRLLNGALKVFPGSPIFWHAVLRTLMNRGDFAAMRLKLQEPEVVAVFGPAWCARATRVCSEALGDAARAGACAGELRELEGGTVNRMTAGNLRTLARKALAKNVQMVCMSYPMHPVAPLEGVLRDFAKTVVFVDNEAVFRKAVARGGYARYFLDVYGGDFGHLTAEGARVLAENVADGIAPLFAAKPAPAPREKAAP